MSHLLQEFAITCPYCAETIELQLDLSAGDQAYVEDCQVCCRPIELELRVSGERFELTVRRDDD
jgi:hypothetical protein